MLISPIAGVAEGTFAAVATNIAYPVADLLLLTAIIGVCALSGWRPARGWVVIGVALCTLGVSDTLHLYQLATESYELGTPLDSGWIVAFGTLGVAAWQPPGSFAMSGRLDGSRVLAVPLVFVGIALGVLVAAEPLDVPAFASGLAAAAIVASAARLWLSFREVQALAVARREAGTDELTGLANRRRLFRDLGSALAEAGAGERELALLVVDLDGFKELNDTFGHHAGDLLLRQIGPRLRGVLPHAEVARPAATSSPSSSAT